MDAFAWAEDAKDRLEAEFGERLRFVGLQGSRARGEAREGSDVDLVVLLDGVGADDLARYRAIVRSMPDSNLACGFVGSEAVLAAWPRHELFQFYHDTAPLFGALPDVGPFSREDALQAARVGASGIYHAACHAYVFDGDGADGILESLFKGAFFALQALQFARTGTYPRAKAELSCQLEGDEARILAIGRDWGSHRPADDDARRDLVDLLLRWSEGVMLLGSRRTGPEKHPSVDVEIREATPEEWALLPDFTYEAIFKRPGDGPVPRTVLQHPALEGYYLGFGSGDIDRCLVAVADGAVVGAVWTRAAAGYGSVDAETPELAMSLYPEWRGMGIGSRLLDAMLRIAEGEGWEHVSLSVQLDNFAHGMYLKAGFEPVEIRGGEAVMVKRIG
ncbi:MAG TPA: GNAT family N-acetyltransferase [Candidatus Aphodovivens avistercoris]|nr:GNAT family N-acetyltransferase [Candidatus Aphodovivens avistercoris]